MEQIPKNPIIEREGCRVLKSKKGMKIAVTLFGWIKLPLRLHYINASTLIDISEQQTYITDVDSKESVDAVVLRKGKEFKHLSRMVALTCLNGVILNFLFARPLSTLLRWSSMDADDWFNLMSLVKMHRNASVFFYTMTSTKDLNLLSRSEESTREESVSSEQSPISENP